MKGRGGRARDSLSRREMGAVDEGCLLGYAERGGGGLFHPLPVSPTPISDTPSIHCQAGFKRETPRRSCFHPRRGIRANRHALPPREGGGRRPRERPGGGAWQPQKTSQRRGDPGHHTMSDLALWAFIPAPPGEPLNWSLTGAGIVVLLVAVTNIPPNKRISSQMSWHSLTG